MNPEEKENDTPQNESEVVEPESTEEVVEEGVEESTPTDNKELQSALAQKERFRDKFEKAEAERRALEKKLNQSITGGQVEEAARTVEEFIDISTSLDGLDQREKAYLAEQHRLSGKPLKDIRESEDFQLWDEAYRTRLEKEAALRPNATQVVEDEPQTLQQRLRNATAAEKEKILTEAGLYKSPRPKTDRVDIGKKISG